MPEQKEFFLEKSSETSPRKWTYETCRDVALRYTFQRDMRRENRNALDAARRNGWIKDFGWLIDGRKTGEKRPRKWTYEACLEEAKKYETVADFQKGSGSAYNAARNNGWIKDCNWFVDGNKRNALKNTKWTYETCLALAKQCSCSSEMSEKNSAAYARALKNGWIKECTWFEAKRKTKWTYEECRSIALKYKVKRDFAEGDYAAYQAALYYGWIKSFDWFVNGYKKGIRRSPKKPIVGHKKYSDEAVIAAAKKYIHKMDFYRNDQSLYLCALHRGLMSTFDWFVPQQHLFDDANYVYRYYYKEKNAVYVGRTIDPEKRDFDHHRDRGKESSSVMKFAKEHGIGIPEMEILERGLTGEESQIKEDEYVKRYKAEGMLVLNKGATGKGTGSLGMKKKYSKKKVLNIARQYTELSEFQRQQHGAYEAACKNGWIQECDWLTRKVRKSSVFTKEFCMNIARQCTSRKELKKKDSTVYGKMIRTGWIEECDWLESAHKERKDLPYDYCIEIAKGYKTANQINKFYRTVAKKLYKTGWIRDCTWLLEINRPVNQYSLDGEFVNAYASSYEAERAINGKLKYFQQAIARTCNGEKPNAYGFIWRYADAEDMPQSR